MHFLCCFFKLFFCEKLIDIAGLGGEILGGERPKGVVEEVPGLEHILRVFDESTALLHKLFDVSGLFTESQQQEAEERILKPLLREVLLELGK
jgi:hypothetical protein